MDSVGVHEAMGSGSLENGTAKGSPIVYMDERKINIYGLGLVVENVG